MKKYYFLHKGCFIPTDVMAANERDARKQFRELYNVKTLHCGQFWKE